MICAMLEVVMTMLRAAWESGFIIGSGHWGLLTESHNGRDTYDLTRGGTKAFSALGIDLGASRVQRRQFACGCID
jgi:hypothetical protein